LHGGGAAEELAPDGLGLRREDRLRVGFGEVPVAAAHLALELRRRPARVAGEDAKAVGRGARGDDRAHRLAVRAHVDAFHQLDRVLVGRLRRAHHDEELLALHRAAEEEHVGAAP
jgi:hypothetical protein